MVRADRARLGRNAGSDVDLNERQRKVLQPLLDAGDGGFKGGMNAEKAVKMTGASKATATRDRGYLVARALLWTTSAGKALRYPVAVPGWTPAEGRDDVAGERADPDKPTAAQFPAPG